MGKRKGFKEEIMKAEKPYEYWLSQNERWREKNGKSSADIKDFLEHYEIVRPKNTVNDPCLEERFAFYAGKGDYDLLFCDDDIVTGGKRQNPFFKPEYAPETYESYGNIFGVYAIRKEFREKHKRWEKYLVPQRVKHIPEVLCHYVKERDGIKRPLSIAKKAEKFDDYSLSIVILSKDHPDMLERCAESLIESGLPEKTEIVVVDNGSTTDNRTLYRRLKRKGLIEYYYKSSVFNYAELCNYGAQRTTGEYLLFLNDDVEVPEEGAEDFVYRLLYYARKDNVGAVGMKLLYPEGDLIQHCGITLLSSGPSHKLCGYTDSKDYYFGINKRNVNMLAVTGACLCLKKSLFDEIGGFDTKLPLAYNDVDLCLRLVSKGLVNVCVNECFLYHHESFSRKDDTNDLGAYRKLREYRDYFYKKHAKLLESGDPFYNRNLTKTGLDYVPDVMQEWETSKVETGPIDEEISYKQAQGINYRIDSAKYRVNDAYGNEDFFEVSGWIFMEKKDAQKFEPAVVISGGKKRAVYPAVRVFREDVEQVFPKQPNACMSGFYTRIAHISLEYEGLNGSLHITPVLVDKYGTAYIGE